MIRSSIFLVSGSRGLVSDKCGGPCGRQAVRRRAPPVTDHARQPPRRPEHGGVPDHHAQALGCAFGRFVLYARPSLPGRWRPPRLCPPRYWDAWPSAAGGEKSQREYRMPLYECVLIARSDVTQQQVESIADQVAAQVEGDSGAVKKREYWGLRSLSYRIKKNRKGHYMLLGLEA